MAKLSNKPNTFLERLGTNGEVERGCTGVRKRERFY